MIVSRSHAGKVKGLVTEKFGKNVVMLSAAGSGYKVVQVLEGNATIYLHNTRIKKWDICAGNALMDSVGGHMLTLDGSKITYGLESKSNPVLEGGLLVELNKNFF